MNLSQQILSEITIFNKYARYLPQKKRRETWPELVERNIEMHVAKFPNMEKEIREAYVPVFDKQVLPSMRSIQFAGKAIKVNPSRLFNCSYCPIDDYRAFSEIMFLLLGGVGVGYSVQRFHVGKLPEIRKPVHTRRYVIGDSIEGWADAIKMLIKAYLCGRSRPLFVFDQIRPKGSLLVTAGGKAPGPEPLRNCLEQIRSLLDSKNDGEKLSPLECHDIICIMSDAVLAGGIRRAASISLFSIDDTEMMTAKTLYNVDSVQDVQRINGSYSCYVTHRGRDYNIIISAKDYEQYTVTGKMPWYYFYPWRARANNSVVAVRGLISEKRFMEIWDQAYQSQSGEPGIFLTNDSNWGVNPSLRRGTRVYTEEGIFPIEELEDREFVIRTLDGTQAPARCWMSGRDKPLHKITLQGGKTYYATAEHKWPVWDGSTWQRTATTELCSGDRLPVIRRTSLFEGTKGDYEDGFFAGWLYGDGWVTTRSDDGRRQYGLIVGSEKQGFGIQDRLLTTLHTRTSCQVQFHDRQGHLELNTSNNSLDEYLQGFGVSHKGDGLPSAIWQGGSEAFRRGFLDGIFSSDGWVEQSKKRVGISSSQKALINDISDLLGFYGVRHTVTKHVKSGADFPNGKEYDRDYAIYTLRITEGRSLQHFKELVSLSHPHKQAVLDGYKFPRPFEKDQIEIISVEETDLREDVWDIQVQDTTHSFQISHCITGNCGEVSLRPHSFCNLTTVRVSDVETQEELDKRVQVAAFIGTLQATYTDFYYLRDVWRHNTEREGLLGISMTGIAMCTNFAQLDLKQAVQVAIAENKRLAQVFGISEAARISCVKPEGTSSCVLGTTSGIHGGEAPFYIRRIRINKDDPLYVFLKRKHPELVADEVIGSGAVIEIPQRCPEGAILKSESPTDLLRRVQHVYNEWVLPGHKSGHNTHNVSVTVYVKENEWEEVRQWLWQNRDSYTGMTVFPYDGGLYVQAPFEPCSEETYHEMMGHLREIDLSQIIEADDSTNLQGELACSGGTCELR